MNGTQNPHFHYFIQAFAAAKRVAPFYMVAAIILLIFAKPAFSVIGLTVLLASGCAILQLWAAHHGSRLFYWISYYSVVAGFAGLVYFRVGTFNLSTIQVVATVALFIAIQRLICAYFHKYAFDGMSFSTDE